MSRLTPNIDEVFFAALERESPEARAAYLDEVCASDPELRRRVLRLLDAQPRMGNFLDAPAAGPTLTLANLRRWKAPARSSDRTNCWNKSAKGAWASSTWPSRVYPYAAGSL